MSEARETDPVADEYVVESGRLVGVDYAGNGWSRDDLRTEVPSPRKPRTIAEGPDRAYASECDDCGFQRFEDDGQPDLIPVCIIEDAGECHEPADQDEVAVNAD